MDLKNIFLKLYPRSVDDYCKHYDRGCQNLGMEELIEPLAPVYTKDYLK